LGDNPLTREPIFRLAGKMRHEGVSRLPSIGEALRSAREAQGRSVEEASAATRIRSSYLEALEQERFEELGGNVYAKGFLRSYANFLGIDPAPLLDAYRAQERPDAPLFEHAPKAIAARAGGRRGPTWIAVAIVCVSIVLLVSLWSLLRPAPDPTNTQPPFAPEPATTVATADHPLRPAGGDRHPALRRAVLDEGHRRRDRLLRGHAGRRRAAHLPRQALHLPDPRRARRRQAHRQRQGPRRPRPLRRDLAPLLHPW
jgi:cytoskeleton protein RodZ